MFRYRINGKEVTFDSISARQKGLAEAEANNFTIERLEIDTKDVGPKEAPEAGDFQSPPQSANAEDAKEAQQDTELPQEDGSSEFQGFPPVDNQEIDLGGEVPFTFNGKEVTEEEYKALNEAVPEEEKDAGTTFNPWVSDPIERNEIEEELREVQNTLSNTFSASPDYKELAKREAQLQARLQESETERMFAIEQMPAGSDKEVAEAGLNPEQKEVYTAMKKVVEDTNSYSVATEKGILKDVPMLAMASRMVNESFGFSKDTQPDQVLKYDQAVYSEVASIISEDKVLKGRLNYNTATLEVKENLLKEARVNAYKKASKNNAYKATNLNEDLVKDSNDATQQIAELNAQIKKVKGVKSNKELDQSEIDQINILGKQINSIIAGFDRRQTEAEAQFEKLKTDQTTLAGAYKIDLAANTIGNAFKKSDIIEKYKKESSAELGGFAKGLNSFLQSTFQLAVEGEIGLPTVAMAKMGSFGQGLIEGDTEKYNVYDAFFDTVKNNMSYDQLGVEASTVFENGKSFWEQDGSEIFALAGDGVGFTLQLMRKAKQGQVDNYYKAIGDVTSKTNKFKKILSKDNIEFITAKATVEAVTMSNYANALDAGMDKNTATIYSAQQSLMTAAIQMIYPDIKMITPSKSILTSISKLPGNLQNAAIKKAVFGGGAKLLGGVSMEYLEELTESIGERALNGAFAIANSEFLGDQWWVENKKILLSTMLISGPLSGVGATKTAINTYDNFTNVAEWQMNIALGTLHEQKRAMLKEQKKPGSGIKAEDIAKIDEAISFANKMTTALKNSPANVSGAELQLLIEKQELVEKNKDLDPAFRGDNDAAIKILDEKIKAANKTGKAAKFVEEAATKDVETARKINKALDLGSELEAYDTQQEIDDRIDELKVDGAEDTDIDKTAYGVIIAMKDGSDVILINKEAAIKDGRINTAAHELLHRYLKNTLKNDTGNTAAVGKSLNEYYKSLGMDSNGEFEARRAQAARDFGENSNNYNEELITMLSEAMLDGKVKPNQGNIGKLIDGVKRLLSINKDITLDDGKSVFDFVKEYNRSIKKGKASKKIQKGAAGIKGKLIKDEGTKATKTNKLSSRLQERFDKAEEALDDAEDLYNLDQYDPSLKKAVEDAQKEYDLAEAALDAGVAPVTESTTASPAVEPVKKEKIVRPKADKSKRKYSLDKEVKKELEPKIAKVREANRAQRAAEKKLNEEAIAAINAISDKVESRSDREKRIIALRAKPLTIRKEDEITKLEAELVKELAVPISKATNLLTRVFYDRISENAKKAVSKDDFKASVRAEITNYTLNEFKPVTVNREGETVFNDIEDIIFQRGYFRMRDKAEREGVVGKASGISKGADALTNIAAEGTSSDNFDENSNDYVAFREKRKVSSLLTSSERYNLTKEKVQEFWNENEGVTKFESFKGVPNLINDILAEMFGVREGTLTARSGNLNDTDFRNAIEAFTKEQAVYTIKENGIIREERVALEDVSEFQSKLSEKRAEDKSFSFKRELNETMAEGFLKFLPLSSAPQYKYESGRKGRYSGKSTGLPKNLMALAYQREGRETKGVGNEARSQKENLTIEDVLEAIGAGVDPEGNITKKMSVTGRDREGQTMLGIIKLFGRMTTNELSRTETTLDPMTKEDLAAGKNPNMYSAKIKFMLAPFNPAIFKPENFITKALSTEELQEIYDILNNEFIRTKGKMDGLDAVNIVLEHTATNYGRQPGAIYRMQFRELYEKFDPSGYSQIEAQIKLVKDLQYSFGEAFKYATQDKALNIEWNKIEALKEKGVSKETKVETIKNYVTRWNRAGRDIDYSKNFNFLGATNNTAVFKALSEATGMSEKQLGTLGFTLAKTGGITTINFNKKPLKLSTAADFIKKDLNVKSKAKNNAAVVTINKDAGRVRQAMYDVLDPAIEKGDIGLAKSLLALMGLSQNGITRKLAKFGRNFVINIGDQTVLDHNPSMSDVNSKIVQYIEGKIDKATLNAYLDKTTINNISKAIDEQLKKEGSLEEDRYNLIDNYKGKVAINVNYGAKNKQSAKLNGENLPKNLRVEGQTLEQSLKQAEAFDKAIDLGNSLDRPTRGISVWDFDDTLATTKSNVLYTMPDGTKGKLDASRFAKEGDTFLANGAEFDFSEFSKVMSGAKGPFFNKAVDRNKKFGNKDVYILTARPANSANAIHEFLKGIGLNIPLANITGLASSDPQAKANWVVGKFAEGYNDFYFADDHVGNVAAVGDALSRLDDVQSKVELAKAAKYSKKIRAEYSTILDKLRGGDVIEGNKVFSAEQQIDDVFDWVKSLDIPEKNQAKYKKAALNFVAKSPTNFPVDTEIVAEAIRIAELKKLNVMSFDNPRDIIDKFAGEVKDKRLDPNKEKQFFNKKSLPEGVETFQIMPTRRGQQAVRKILDTHWGKKTNPWCVTVQKNEYTPAEQKERKENPPGIAVGTEMEIAYEAIVNAGVVESYITFDNMGNRVEDVMFDFIGNLKPGWVVGKADYDSTDHNDQWVIDRENEQDFNEELNKAKAEGYTIREGSYDTSQDNFYVQMERNNDPEVNKVHKYVSYYKAKDPNVTQEEFDNGPAKGGAVKNPEIYATGPIKLTSGSFNMWVNYGKPLFTENVNEDTGAVEIDDGGFEIAFKDGKLLALKNLGGNKQEWFDRMDHGTKDLALKVPRNAKGKINGKSTMMNTDSGRVFSRNYTTKYSKKLEGDINFLTNELSTKGEALPGQSTNLDAQPKAVKDVINTLDVKSKTQQSRIRYSKTLDQEFNKIIEQESGIEDFKEYKSVKAALKGKVKKFRMKFFIPPSAEDFLGLLYTTLPKGKQGEAALAFYTEHLLQPYARAINGLRKGRIAMAKDYKAVKKQLGIVPKELKKTFKYEDENGKMKESLFSKEMAIRVYVWDAQGIDIEGLSDVDLPILVNYVNANPDLKAFGDQLLALNKGKKSATPNENWPAGTITSDLLNDLNTEGRKQLLELWQQNVDVIFSSKNMSKLEAAYGENYVVAVKDALRRMKSGRNTVPTPNTVTDTFVRWLNGAVGNIMFLNRRSAVLQLISFTNFINFEGNNLYQASKAFANQPQYWKDWIYLMNSDYLVDRRDGLRINVNEADIATTAKEGGFQGVLAKILKAGFLPTKMADSAAIATGGASFYRNRVNTYLNEKTINGTGYTLEQAEKQAMEDFIATAEVSQQSSDPSKSSKQQAEPIGRIILAFANTPSQYARIMKRSAQDLYNGRGKPATHISRIVYYGVIQNAVFNYLQQAMFAAMFGDDDESDEEMTEVQEASNDKKLLSVANSMTDGILRGIGVAGVIFSVLKNLGIKIYQRSDKKRNKNYKMTIYEELLKMSPPLSSKLTKLGKVGSTIEWGQKEIEFDKMSLKHPYVTATASAIAGVTSLPVDRAVGMAIDAVDVASADTEAWMKPLIIMGWPKWQLESEATKAATKEAEKERFKELEGKKERKTENEEFSKLDETERRRLLLTDMTKKEQVDKLYEYGLKRWQVNELDTEGKRVDKLMGLQDKEQYEKDMESLSKGEEMKASDVPTTRKPEPKVYSKEETAKRKKIEKLSKAQQVSMLYEYNLKRWQVNELSSEESRINKIIELQNKKRKNSLK